MAPLAQRLPVVLIPEELRITPVRNDVVHNRGFRQLLLCQALDAKRMGV